MFDFIKKDRLKADQLLNDTVNYMITKFKQSKEVFSFSSSYGQIILVTQNLFKINLFYKQDAITQLNYHTANRRNTIFGNAVASGHSAMRGSSAYGEISLAVKKEGLSKMGGSIIYFANYTRIKCLNNGLEYLVDLGGVDDTVIDLKNLSTDRFKILEGKLEFQPNTGTGEDLQSYNVNVPSGQMIDDQFVIISSNNNKYKIYESFYDIPFGERGCLVKTSLSNGIDVFFHTKLNTTVPQIGETIRTDFLITSGSLGNIYDKTGIEFQWLDTGLDINGNEVNLNDVLQIQVEMPPQFGADSERPEMTRILSAYKPMNPILHDENSIKFYFMRMNYFSNVVVTREFTDISNLFKCLLYTKVTDRLVGDEDYFSVDTNKFTLSTIEQTRLLNSIDESGIKSSNIEIKIITPELRRFVVILILDVFDRFNGITVKKEDVRREVRKAISAYMFKNKRVTQIPHSDIVRIIDEINIIDKVKVVFVPQNPEDIDTMGNISVGENQFALMRGNFTDASAINYLDDFDPEGELMGSVNLDIRFIKNTFI